MAAERYEISLLVFKNISLARCAHTWNILPRSMRNFVKSNVEREINICPYLGVRNTPYLGNDVTVLHLLLVVEAG